MNPLLRLSNWTHDVENTITPTIPDYYCSTIMLHDGCRTTDFHLYPKTSNLHDGCRATDSDCGTSRPFIAIQTTRGNKAKTRSVVPRAAPWSAATCRTARHHGTRQHRELRGSMERGST